MSKKSRRARRVAPTPTPAPAPRRAASRPSVAPAPHARPADVDRLSIVALGLAIAAAAAYLPALRGEFINWDDPVYVTNNADVRRGLSWQTITWAFTTFHGGNWHPLTWLSLALDNQLYGLAPAGYHVTSLALHVANTILVLLVLHRLTGTLWRSAAVAALFALHPLHVESVAWVAERKDVLSGFFWLATMAAYCRFIRVRTAGSYVLVAVLFALALLSKPMAVTLPLALLLLDYWPLERLSWDTVREKVPLFVLAAVQSVSTFAAQRAEGAVGIDPIPFASRLANAIVAYVRYLELTVWPTRLSPWYSHPALEGAPLTAAAVAGALLFLGAVTALAIAVRRSRPWIPVGWLWYLGTLVPVIGVIQVGRQAMADRYTYLPHIGLFVAVVWTIGELPFWRARTARVAGATATALLLVVLGVLTFRQTAIWHDTLAFWSYTARTSPSSFIAHQALAGLYFGNRPDESITQYRWAVRLRPEHADSHARLGLLLARKGKLGPAAAQYRKAIALRDSPDDHNGLGDVLLRQGHPVQARRQVEQALALKPGFAEAHDNLGRVLMAEGRIDEAVAEFQAALRTKPGLVSAQRNLDAARERQRAGAQAPPTESR